MAKELQFKLGGKDYGAAPVKLESVDGDKYALILRLTNLELKPIE